MWCDWPLGTRAYSSVLEGEMVEDGSLNRYGSWMRAMVPKAKTKSSENKSKTVDLWAGSKIAIHKNFVDSITSSFDYESRGSGDEGSNLHVEEIMEYEEEMAV